MRCDDRSRSCPQSPLFLMQLPCRPCCLPPEPQPSFLLRALCTEHHPPTHPCHPHYAQELPWLPPDPDPSSTALGKAFRQGPFPPLQALQEAGVREGVTPVSTLSSSPGLRLPPQCGRESGEEPQKPPKCLNLQTLKIAVTKSMHTSQGRYPLAPLSNLTCLILSHGGGGGTGLQEVVADDPPGGRSRPKYLIFQKVLKF